MITDNPNVMEGNKRCVFKRLNDMNPALLDLGWCSLCPVMNAMQAGVKKMPNGKFVLEMS